MNGIIELNILQKEDSFSFSYWNYSSEKEKNHILFEEAIPLFKEKKLLPNLIELTLVVDKNLVVAAFEPINKKVALPIKVVPHYNEVSIYSTRPSKAQYFTYSNISKRIQDKYPYMLLYHNFLYSTGDSYEFSNPTLDNDDVESLKRDSNLINF